MFFDALFNHIYFKRAVAACIDFFIELGGAVLGAYFGAMVAALIIAWSDLGAESSPKAIWTGLISGFLFWGLVVSWINRVLIQGVSRSTIGKKYMQLEVISLGAPIDWKIMMKYWVSATFAGELRVVSSLDQTGMAPVIPLKPKTAGVEKSDDKKAA